MQSFAGIDENDCGNSTMHGQLTMYIYVYQAAQDEEANNNNGQLATGRLRGSVDPMATNCSSPASSSSPSLASLEQQTADDMCAPSLEISLGRRHWSAEERPEGVSLK
jgi:hypothetical protein